MTACMKKAALTKLKEQLAVIFAHMTGTLRSDLLMFSISQEHLTIASLWLLLPRFYVLG